MLHPCQWGLEVRGLAMSCSAEQRPLLQSSLEGHWPGVSQHVKHVTLVFQTRLFGVVWTQRSMIMVALKQPCSLSLQHQSGTSPLLASVLFLKCKLPPSAVWAGVIIHLECDQIPFFSWHSFSCDYLLFMASSTGFIFRAVKYNYLNSSDSLKKNNSDCELTSLTFCSAWRQSLGRPR